jgi:hypothetical protein
LNADTITRLLQLKGFRVVDCEYLTPSADRKPPYQAINARLLLHSPAAGKLRRRPLWRSGTHIWQAAQPSKEIPSRACLFFCIIKDKVHEREVENIILRAAGPQLVLNQRKMRDGVEPGGVRDYEPAHVFPTEIGRRAGENGAISARPTVATGFVEPFGQSDDLRRVGGLVDLRRSFLPQRGEAIAFLDVEIPIPLPTLIKGGDVVDREPNLFGVRVEYRGAVGLPFHRVQQLRRYG